MPNAQELLAANDPKGALSLLQQQVRANAADPKLRVFLFQLLCVLGQWPRALDQLHVCGELDAGALAMVNTYRPAVQCEMLREAVMSGRTLPHVFGPPAAWVALLAQALAADAAGESAQAASLRDAAFEQAPASRGTLDGRPFEWIADADSRLGPVLEAIINGRYGWIPFAHLRQVKIEPPTDLRDMVWIPAFITFANDGETVALLPARYAGTATGTDGALLMSRKTDWVPLADGQFRGIGQRVLATPDEEAGLLGVHEIVLDAQHPDPSAVDASPGEAAAAAGGG